MPGRRSYNRYGVIDADGTLRVVRDVTVECGVEQDITVLSTEPALAGELLMFERIVDGQAVRTQVQVVESRLAVVAGSVRHQLRLKRVDGHASSADVDSER